MNDDLVAHSKRRRVLNLGKVRRRGDHGVHEQETSNVGFMRYVEKMRRLPFCNVAELELSASIWQHACAVVVLKVSDSAQIIGSIIEL